MTAAGFSCSGIHLSGLISLKRQLDACCSDSTVPAHHHASVKEAAVAHYTIDTDDDERFVEGDYGEGLTCPQKARALALAVLPEMALEKGQVGDCHAFSATVRDENGREVYTATLTLVGKWKAGRRRSDR